MNGVHGTRRGGGGGILLFMEKKKKSIWKSTLTSGITTKVAKQKIRTSGFCLPKSSCQVPRIHNILKATFTLVQEETNIVHDLRLEVLTPTTNGMNGMPHKRQRLEFVSIMKYTEPRAQPKIPVDQHITANANKTTWKSLTPSSPHLNLLHWFHHSIHRLT